MVDVKSEQDIQVFTFLQGVFYGFTGVEVGFTGGQWVCDSFNVGVTFFKINATCTLWGA